MGKSKWMKRLAGFCAAMLLIMVPVKAEAAEWIHSEVYGDAIYLEENGIGAIMFVMPNEHAAQLVAEMHTDPYYQKYMCMNNTIIKVKSTASVIAELDDDTGNIVRVLTPEEISQSILGYQQTLAALDANEAEAQYMAELKAAFDAQLAAQQQAAYEAVWAAQLAAQQQAANEAALAAQQQAAYEAALAAQQQAANEAALAAQQQAAYEAALAAQQQAANEAALAAQQQAAYEAALAAQQQ